MPKYIVKLTDNQNEFYGYLAKHVEDNTFYVNNIFEAALFDSKEQAEQTAKEFIKEHKELQFDVMTTTDRVYLVIQHQSSDPEFDNRTVYVCKTKQLAEYAAAKLNRKYSYNATLDEDNNFVEVPDGAEDWHYYTVESYAVEETKADIDEYDM